MNTSVGACRRAVTAIASASLVGAVAVAAQAPDVYELRCRGGGNGAFEFRNISSTRLATAVDNTVGISLAFTPSPSASGTDGQGLPPGTCAWIDRVMNDGEPAVVQFKTSAYGQLKQPTLDTSSTAAERYPDPPSMGAYLADPNHYWSFYVYNTNRGYLEATRHRFWTADGIGAKGWKVEASVSGGLEGATTSVSVTADGQVVMDSPRLGIHCAQQLPAADLRALDEVVSKARPTSWLRKYALPKNPDGCCDMFQMSLRLERQAGDERRVQHSTLWYVDSDSRVAPDARDLFATAFAAKKVCLAAGGAGANRN